MSSGKVSDVSVRRGQFFEYFRARHRTATRSDLSYPDRMVLLTACLDALANHWSSTEPAVVRKDSANRMRLFLQRHAHHPAFAKVSAPLLRDRSKAHRAQLALANSDAVLAELEASFPFARYRSRGPNLVATWKDDPEFADVEQRYVCTEKARKLLVDCSYGGILYKDLRCAWVHNFLQTNEQILTPADDGISNEPYYRHVSNTGQFLLIIPESFLAATVERALGSFQRDAEERNILPFDDNG